MNTKHFVFLCSITLCTFFMCVFVVLSSQILLADSEQSTTQDYVLTVKVIDDGFDAQLEGVLVEQKRSQNPPPGDVLTVRLRSSSNSQTTSNILFEESFFVSTKPLYHGNEGSYVLESTHYTIRVPYDTRATHIELETTKSHIYSLTDFLCNRDGSCNNGENALVCPSECAANSNSDGKCVPKIDGICDADCDGKTSKTTDIDCQNPNLEIPSQNNPQTNPSTNENNQNTNTNENTNANENVHNELDDALKESQDCFSDGFCNTSCQAGEDLDCMQKGSFPWLRLLIFSILFLGLCVLIVRAILSRYNHD